MTPNVISLIVHISVPRSLKRTCRRKRSNSWKCRRKDERSKRRSELRKRLQLPASWRKSSMYLLSQLECRDILLLKLMHNILMRKLHCNKPVSLQSIFLNNILDLNFWFQINMYIEKFMTLSIFII